MGDDIYENKELLALCELEKAMSGLLKARLASGLWPRFSGGEPSEFISLSIAARFGKLQARRLNLGNFPNLALSEMVVTVIPVTDIWLEKWYRNSAKKTTDFNKTLSATLRCLTSTDGAFSLTKKGSRSSPLILLCAWQATTGLSLTTGEGRRRSLWL